MAIIRRIVDEYPYVAMDTEFPGVVARPVGKFQSSGEYHYQMLRCGPCCRCVVAADSAECLLQFEYRRWNQCES
jgi:hypothetical protein